VRARFERGELSPETRGQPGIQGHRDLRNLRLDLDDTVPSPHKARTGEFREVHGSGQGATPGRGGGKPEQVGDRSRPQDGCPVATDVGMGDGKAGATGLPHPGMDHGPVVDRDAEAGERLGDAREGHGSDGRTIIGISGRRRDLG
jgi:hypothetical protein